VQTGSTFNVVIQVGYSAKFGMVDVGIWDLANGTVVRSLVSNATLGGAGNSTYTLTIKAPATPYEWHLSAIARAWVQDAWFYDSEGRFDFTIIVTDHAYLTLMGLQSNSTVHIDGRTLVVNQSTIVIPLQLGEAHEVEVGNLIQVQPGTRLVFVGWSDGVDSNPRDVLLTENVTMSPIYNIQYLLSVSSELGSTVGGGWYWEGSVAEFGVPTTTQHSSNFFGLLANSFRFTGWSGDDNSTTPTSTIEMNGPKGVNAQWSGETTIPSPSGIATVFTALSIFLALRAGRLIRKQRRGRFDANRHLRSVLILLLIAVILPFSTVRNVFGALPAPHDASVVSVGDASWYYWAQPGSDTCLLWLGGGLENPQGGYLINPFEYESFGTIRFLQDLTKYYCVIALEKGSSPSNDYPNRTIYQEYFQGQLSIARQLHEWIKAQGYAHVFLIGYSVGTEAAASIALADTRTWSSSDGLILITANLAPDLVSEATGLDTNLLLLYGHAPAYEPSGERFYELAPGQGLNGATLHKEYHLLDQMGHEVWSPLRDNSYSPLALGIVVNFIEASIALQQSPVTFTPTSSGNWNYSIVDVEAPPRIMGGSPFLAMATVNSNRQAVKMASVVAYDPITQRILTVTHLTPNQSMFRVRLVIPPISNTSLLSFSVLVLEWLGNRWVPASNQYLVRVATTNQVRFHITGLVPNSSIILDKIAYDIPTDGEVQFNISVGTHNVVIPSVIEQPNRTYSFAKWSDGDRSTNRTVNLQDDALLTTFYQTQYYVQVTSPFGTVTGTGWHEANSTVEPSLQSGLEQSGSFFRNWTSGSTFYGLGEPIPVESPTAIQGVWEQYPPASTSNPLTEFFLPASVLLFSLLLILNLKLSRRHDG
jgi:pimeloyl-ACP methyl ester carboxylesterase